MYNVILKTRYRKDCKKTCRTPQRQRKLKEAVALLAHSKPLPERLRDHGLKGHWKGYRECHIEPDWLLIYKKEAGDLILVRLGSHAELFG